MRGEMSSEQIIELVERFEDSYDRLVDQTENKFTLWNERKNDRLKLLLKFCEYLRGEEDENPIIEWFKY